MRRSIAVCAAIAALGFAGSSSHADSVRCQAKDNLCLIVGSQTGAARALEIDGENVLPKPGGLFLQDCGVLGTP